VCARHTFRPQHASENCLWGFHYKSSCRYGILAVVGLKIESVHLYCIRDATHGANIYVNAKKIIIDKIIKMTRNGLIWGVERVYF
jgi:hypothetical protein